ncbi:MAG: cyclic dehypoxanthine futalosine synthase [Fimbriimonadales bacterium]|nr:MAG: cyclic dehypoxanthine futalosine synthase [Fimbriimonadales bacterium]
MLETPMPTERSRFQRIAEKVLTGERLNFEDGVALFQHPNLPELGALAHHVRMQKNPQPYVTYVIGRIINYTNVCWVRCKFCAFYRPPNHNEGYLLSDEEILQKIDELVQQGGVEALIQGGLNPKLKIDYYEHLFRLIKTHYPQVIIHGLSPTEILYIAHISRLSVRETLTRLKEAGLNSVPGAGGEILVNRVRQQIAPFKDMAQEWLDFMREAHLLGLRSTASMMYGHVETIEDRVEHLIRLREVQDETGGFTAFVCWNFQPEGTDLPDVKKATPAEYLRTVAVARLMLDNFDHLQASILTQGPKVITVALRYGVDDMGSTMIEENVVSAQGSKFILNAEEIERVIRAAGFIPKRRNTRYERLD